MNYGKRRLFFLTEQQIKEGWKPSRHMPDRRARIRFTVRQWGKFNVDQQMYLTKIFHIILTDHRTRKEKAIHILKKFNKKNMDKGIDKFNAGVKSFSDSMKQIHFDPSGIDPIEGTWGKKKNLPDTAALMWGRKERPARKSKRHHSREPTTKELFWGKG